MRLDIRLLGHFSLLYEEKQLYSVHRARLQFFLAYLLLHSPPPLLRRNVAFIFWPDSSETQARNNLRKLLHELRRILPHADQFLHLDTHTIHWKADAAYTLDVFTFEELLSRAETVAQVSASAERAQLEEAVRLYHGDLLPACYEDWILPERERLRQAFCRALERLVRLCEDEGDYNAAITHANHLLRTDPLHESTYRRLMRLHALTGDRATALQVYHACTAQLQQELGVEPGADIQAAYTELLSEEIPQQLRSKPVRSSHATRFIGRKREWQSVRDAWRIALGGSLHLCLIQGDAGIGKTRLVEELLTRVGEHGFATARTRAYAIAGSLAFAPVIDWLRSPPLQAALQTLDAVWLREIKRLLPEFQGDTPHLPQPETLQARWQRHRLFESLARAFLAIEAPMVLVLDDVQWCDSDTLEWLHFLLDFVINKAERKPSNGQPALLLLLGSRRHAFHENHPLLEVQNAFLAAEQITEIDLNPLDRAETIQMASLLHGGEINAGTGEALFGFTEGNPFFIVETMARQDWMTDVQNAVTHADADRLNPNTAMLPAKIYALIRSQLAGLSTLAHRLADLAAVLGREFDFDLLHTMSGLDETEAIAGLDELWQRGVICVQQERLYDFSHDRIRDVTYAEISPVQRPLLHRRIAQSLEAFQTADRESMSGQIGHHYEQAGEWEAAVDSYQDAADTSAAFYAFDQTTIYLDKILVLLDRHLDNPGVQKRRFECLVAKVDAAVALGGWTSKARKVAIDRAYDLAIKLDDPISQIQALQMQSSFYVGQGYWNKAAGPTGKAMSLAESAGDEEWLMKTRYATGFQLYRQGRFPEAALYFGPELDQPDLASLPSLFFALIHRAQISWMRGYPNRAWRQASDAISSCDQMGFVPGQILTREFAGYMVQRSGNTEALRVLVDEMSALCDTFGYPNTALAAHFLRGWLMVEDGATTEGIDMMQDNFVQSKEIDNLLFLPYYLTLYAVALCRLGHVSRALAALKQARQVVDEYGDSEWLAEILRLTGVMRQRLNHPRHTVDESYRSALDLARRQDAKILELRAAVSLARLWQQQGRARHAHELLSKAYGWFTEGLDTKDLKTAHALLSDLSAS